MELVIPIVTILLQCERVVYFAFHGLMTHRHEHLLRELNKYTTQAFSNVCVWWVTTIVCQSLVHSTISYSPQTFTIMWPITNWCVSFVDILVLTISAHGHTNIHFVPLSVF